MDELQTAKRAIARVEGLDDAAAAPTPLGTAFYVGDGFALSAYHVVADLQCNPPRLRHGRFALKFTESAHDCGAEVVAYDVIEDWVILKCASPPLVQPIEPAALPPAGVAWQSFGYPDVRPIGMTINGKVTDPAAPDRAPDNTTATKGLALLCEQAAAGQGMREHGFSGAPCLVDGKAVGMLRTAMLATALDGTGKPILVTVGGTGFACHAARIIERTGASAALPLPGGWSARRAESDFVVITSSIEARPGRKLTNIVDSAYRSIAAATGLEAPKVYAAEALLVSEEQLHLAIKLLCHARVAVFDATKFEPAVMLLLGVRAAVRRGVTILSIGGSYVLGDRIDIPFNLMDANLVSHSRKQDDAPEGMRPAPLLATRITRGLKAIDQTPQYADLPAYEALRYLPAERRGTRPPTSGVLVLCSFEPKYTLRNWNGALKIALEERARELRETLRNPDGSMEWLGVARSLELKAPQLVSRAIYEEIRRAQSCVVDLTGWPPAVLFELGVRLAVSPHPVGCLLEEGAPDTEGVETQCERLKELLVPREHFYRVGDEHDPLEQQAFTHVYGTRAQLPAAGIASGQVYSWVSEELDVVAEPASRPVYRELLDSARLFAKSVDHKPVSLYPSNTALVRREHEAYFERLVAAALIVTAQYPNDDVLLGTPSARAAVDEVAKAIFADEVLLELLRQELPILHQRLDALMDRLD